MLTILRTQVFFTTNEKDKLDEALIRPGRMDRSFEFKPAESSAIKEQFVRFFNKAPVTDAGVERLPAAHEVQDMAEKFERLVLQAEQDHPSFKKLTLATTQGFFQTKFREGARGNDPMQAAVDGFAEFFLPALPKPDAGATSTAPSDIMRSASQQAALTRQFSRGGSRAAAPGLRAPHTI